MNQTDLKLRQNQEEAFTHAEVDANWTEIENRTKHSESGYNSMAELGAKVKLLVETDSGDLPPIVDPAYANIAALLADQGAQITGYIYEVTDASADPNIGEVEVAFYKKKASSTATLADDYEPISDTEITIIQAGYQANVKKLLEKSTSAITTVDHGGFAIRHSAGKATEIILDAKHSIISHGAVLQTATRDYVLQLTNLTRTSEVLLANITGFAYTDGTDTYYKATLVDTINEADLILNDTYKIDLVPNAKPSGNTEPPIDETYANITALIAAQNDQLEDWLYKVTDASDHPDVTTGSATFRYLGTTLGTVADYELEWKEEDKVLTNAEVETAYNSQVDVVLQAEAEAGTSTTVRRWTAERVKQAIYALAVKLSDFLEENLNGTADEALTVTGATNVDLSAAAHRNIKLTGNATLTFTNTPASGKTITRTYKIYSAATETLTIDNSTAEYGEYVADGTENMVTVMCSNTSTEGLDVHVFFTQPN